MRSRTFQAVPLRTALTLWSTTAQSSKELIRRPGAVEARGPGRGVRTEERSASIATLSTQT